jgi:hypothetical protein
MSNELIETQSRAQQLAEKWAPVLDNADLGAIKDAQRRQVTAVLMENTVNEMKNGSMVGGGQSLLETTNITGTGGFSGASAAGGPVAGYDPVLISLLRRSMPNLMAYDVMGVQPMTGPTGLIFAMRSRYANQTGAEAFYNEANTAWSTVRAGNTTIGESHVVGSPAGTPTGNSATYNYAGAMTTGQAEQLGAAGNVAFAEMGFSIEKVTVTARSRALAADYSMELAQDLKAIHGLDAETELANILTAEILAEINREAIRSIGLTAVTGAAATATPGTFNLDVDANGRWSVEKFKGLMFQLERECNAISKSTRRGKGNILICSSDVASALNMAGVLEYNPQLAVNLQVDDTGNTFAGLIGGRIKVYIDPYAFGNYAIVGYKGSNAFDAGLFYCPYVPLQMVRAVDTQSFQPRIGFKTRYGMVANPFSGGATASDGTLVQNANVYYRRFNIENIL